MNNTLYVGLSRQMTLKREMDVIANNLANSDTVGFKVESLLMAQDSEQPALKPSAGASQPARITFVIDNGLARDFGQGALKQTGGTFDLGLQGQGFFQVQTPQGARFTRDGRFGVDAQGQLVDVAGNPVMSDNNRPIRIDPQKTAPSIAHDGTISQDGVIAGKVGVFGFANLGALRKTGNNLYDPGAEPPVAARSATIQQGMIETANLDPIQQMTRMIEVSRAYEQISSMMQAAGDTSDQSIQRLGRVN